MKVKTLLIILIIMIVLPIKPLAFEITPMEKLNDISYEALQMIKTQRYEDAKSILNYFSLQFFQVTGHEPGLTREKVKIITFSRREAMEAAVSPTMDYEKRMNKITKFRLAVDALSSRHQPLWIEMKNPILTAYQSAKAAALAENFVDFHKQFTHFLALYDIVYPSMKIDITANDIQSLDNDILAIKSIPSKKLTENKSKQQLDKTEADLAKIFKEMEKDHADPSLWWVIISTGSIITMTLSYVGWRKYKGEQEVRKNRSR